MPCPHSAGRIPADSAMLLLKKLLLLDLWRILRCMPRRLRGLLYGLFLLMLGVAVLEVLSIFAISFVAMSVAAPQALLENPLVQRVLLLVPDLRDWCADPRHFTLLAAMSVVGLTLLKNALSAVQFWQGSRLGEEVAIFAGGRIMGHFLNSPYLWHLSADSGKTWMTLEARTQLSQTLLHILNVYTYGLTSVALLAALVSITPGVVLCCLTGAALIACLVYSSMKKTLDRCGQAAIRASEEEVRTTRNAMRGIREVLIYRQQPTFLQSYLRACRNALRPRIFINVSPSIPPWILEVCGFAAIPATVWILVAIRDADMAAIASVVTMVMLVAWRILPLLNRSLSSLVCIRGNRAGAMQCLEQLEAIARQELPPQAEPDPDFRFAQEIRLENVSFCYPGAERPALRSLSCVMGKGRQTGIIGISGSGKSTLAGIISGLLTPDSGSLLVDGRELTPQGLAAYTGKIGYVPQTPYLMAGSIAENVAFSQWGKPWDAEKVHRACRMAALDIVETDPRGIEYPLGE
ncbi:MAG: ABC transporter ATP-binding protein, partial [Desulfovibrionaceae bacterium]|nr:ABC transporter ATP-binding protein [Desulfovibrionaceae bacterium]